MGLRPVDQYTLLHFAVGIIIYFFGMPLSTWMIIHTLFEILENTHPGVLALRKIYFWPGGKPHPDSLSNSFWDTIASLLGWLLGSVIDDLGKKYNLYI